MDTTAKLLAIIVLISFATERIMATANYLLDTEGFLRRRKSTTARRYSRRGSRKALLTLLAGAFTLAVVDITNLRVLRIIDAGAQPLLDYWLTLLVVFAGADRARELLQSVKPAPAASQPKQPTYLVDLDRVRRAS